MLFSPVGLASHWRKGSYGQVCAEALGRSIRQRVHALTAEMNAGEIVKKGLSLGIRGFDHQLGRCLLHIELVAPRR